MTSIGSNQYQNLPLKEGVKAEDFKAKVNKALADAPEGKGVITKEEFEDLSKDLKSKESVTELITDLTKDGATFTNSAKESAKSYAGDSVAPKVTALFEKAIAQRKPKETAPTGATEVDNIQVAKIVLEAEDVGKKAYPDDEAKAAKASLDWVIQKRNTGKESDATDVNWAAADHYLFAKQARKEYGGVGGGVVAGLALGYDVVKAGLFLVGQEKLLSDGQPISKPTLSSTIWGVGGGLGADQ